MARLEFSFDFELGWGSIENNLWVERQRQNVYQDFRSVLEKLLSALDSLEIPVTWATVGALVENPLNRDFSYLPGEFRSKIETALANADPSTFYGQDLLESILSRNVEHMLACHSYSHLRFNHPQATEHMINIELQKNIAALSKYQSRLNCFVFPQNIEGYFDVLHENSFNTVRLSPFKRSKKSFLQILQRNLLTPPISRCVEISDHIIGKTESLFFNPGPNRQYLTQLVVLRGKMGLKNAILRNGTFHVWNHPFNFSENPNLLDAFIKFLVYAAKLRDQGKLKIQLM